MVCLSAYRGGFYGHEWYLWQICLVILILPLARLMKNLKAYLLQSEKTYHNQTCNYFVLSDNRFSFSKRRQLLSESVFSSVAGKNSDWLSLSRAFSASSGKYSLAVRGKYGFARLFRNLSEKSRLRCFAVLSVRKAYKTRQPNAIVLWRTISEDNAVLWVFRALKP